MNIHSSPASRRHSPALCADDRTRRRRVLLVMNTM